MKRTKTISPSSGAGGIRGDGTSYRDVVDIDDYFDFVERKQPVGTTTLSFDSSILDSPTNRRPAKNNNRTATKSSDNLYVGWPNEDDNREVNNHEFLRNSDTTTLSSADSGDIFTDTDLDADKGPRTDRRLQSKSRNKVDSGGASNTLSSSSGRGTDNVMVSQSPFTDMN